MCSAHATTVPTVSTLPAFAGRDHFSDIHALVDEERYADAAQSMETLHPVDLAHYLTLSSTETRRFVLPYLRHAITAPMLLALDHHILVEVIERLGLETVLDRIPSMDIADAVYILETLPVDHQDLALSQLPSTLAVTIRDQLSYPENSAGRLMHRAWVGVREHWLVSQVIDYLRYHPHLNHEFYEIFVLDQHFQPLGAVAASRILRSDPSVQIHQLMNPDFRVISAEMDQEDVSYIFTEYNLTSAPVVNKAGRLIGVVSVGDMMEVIEEEAEEDILRLGGLRGLIDIHTDIASTARHRLPWLLINLMLSTLTCLVIQHFEGTIASMALLAAIMPLVASLAGNAGTQTLTVVVRALATKEIESSNSVRVVTKEILAAAINGLGCGVMAGLAVYAWQGSVLLSVILGMALFLNFLVAGLVGASVPMVLKRLGTDPAVASGVFLTTITDVVGFFVFLSLAGFLLL